MNKTQIDNVEEVKEKIKKLLALSKSSNEHEAALAASRAQEILLKYNLSMSDIKLQDSEKMEIEESQMVASVAKWKTTILSAVVELNFCSLLISHGVSTSYLIFGEPHNVSITLETFAYLEAAVNRFTRDYVKRRKAEMEATMENFDSYRASSKFPKDIAFMRDSYKHGISIGLSKRLYERLNELKEKGLGDSSDCTALAVRSYYEQTKTALTDFIRSMYTVKTTKSRSSRVSSQAYSDGQRDSHKVSLDKQIKG